LSNDLLTYLLNYLFRDYVTDGVKYANGDELWTCKTEMSYDT